ncbi:F-box domain [Arabidopsis suecica]|uniref:F-box domain n=1 Tax=Arabidopsis suecica TaxID=45249 RepID=A0A8T1YRG1_ARASU|nr:F-box domain [Arabidopsis suecica]
MLRKLDSAQQFVKQRTISCRRNGVEDRISALPDDLVVRILSLVPTKDAVATMILSKRWRSIWTMVPLLEYREIKDVTHKTKFLGGLLGRLFGKRKRPRSIWLFLNESLGLHKAPILERLDIELGPHCPVDANVGKWITNAVDRTVRELGFQLMWSAGPISLPKSLYTCDTLVYLRLSNKVFVDVSSPVCLPSLKRLHLVFVVYKDEDSVVRLLSSCPILEYLYVVRRHNQDNVTKFSVNVPSLESLTYCNVKPKLVGEEDVEDIGGSLVIDSENLKEFAIADTSTNSCSIENKPRLGKAVIYYYWYPDDKGLLKSEVFPITFKQPNDVPLCLSTKLASGKNIEERAKRTKY